MPDIGERLDAIESRLDKLEKSASVIGWIEQIIRTNPKVATALTALVTIAATWASTYFSVQPVQVPGPEKVIYRDAPVKEKEGPPAVKKNHLFEG